MRRQVAWRPKNQMKPTAPKMGRQAIRAPHAEEPPIGKAGPAFSFPKDENLCSKLREVDAPEPTDCKIPRFSREEIGRIGPPVLLASAPRCCLHKNGK